MTAVKANTDSSRGFMSIGDVRLYYERAGHAAAGKPSVILIHADSLDTRMWDGLFERIAVSFDTVRYDARGFGQSDVPDDTPYSFHDELAGLMDGLGIARAYLIGASLGGATAVDAALAYPEKAAGLVLIDAGLGGFRYSDAVVSALGEVVTLAKHGRLDDAKQLWMSLPFFSVSMQHEPAASRIRRMVTDSSGYRWYGTNQSVKLTPPASGRIGDIAVPMLILHGEYEMPDFVAVARHLLANAGRGSLAVVPGAGHVSLMDNPGFVGDAVMGFLSDTGSA